MGRIKNWGINTLLRQIYEVEKIYKNIADNTIPEEDDEYFHDLKLHIELGVCIECGQSVSKIPFRTEDEKNEYSISALCSDCQRKYFGK